MIKFLNLVLVQAMMGLALLLAIPQEAAAQSISDVASIKVDELSDDQVKALVKKAQDAGLGKEALLEMARSRGMAEAEVEKLSDRIEEVAMDSAPARSSSSLSKREPRQQKDYTEIQQGTIAHQGPAAEEKNNPSYFGLDLFYQKERELTFEPNLNMATPSSYVLGDRKSVV